MDEVEEENTLVSKIVLQQHQPQQQQLQQQPATAVTDRQLQQPKAAVMDTAMTKLQ